MQPDTMKQNSAYMSSGTQELKKANCYCFILSFLKEVILKCQDKKIKAIQLKNEAVKK